MAASSNGSQSILDTLLTDWFLKDLISPAQIHQKSTGRFRELLEDAAVGFSDPEPKDLDKLIKCLEFNKNLTHRLTQMTILKIKRKLALAVMLCADDAAQLNFRLHTLRRYMLNRERFAKKKDTLKQLLGVTELPNDMESLWYEYILPGVTRNEETTAHGNAHEFAQSSASAALDSHGESSNTSVTTDSHGESFDTSVTADSHGESSNTSVTTEPHLSVDSSNTSETTAYPASDHIRSMLAMSFARDMLEDLFEPHQFDVPQLNVIRDQLAELDNIIDVNNVNTIDAEKLTKFTNIWNLFKPGRATNLPDSVKCNLAVISCLCIDQEAKSFFAQHQLKEYVRKEGVQSQYSNIIKLLHLKDCFSPNVLLGIASRLDPPNVATNIDHSTKRQRVTLTDKADHLATILTELFTEDETVNSFIADIKNFMIERLRDTGKALELVRSGTIVDHGDYLELQSGREGWPFVQEQENRNFLYVRQMYRLLFQRWFEKYEGITGTSTRYNVAVTGCAGIGKTTFFAYLIYRLRKLWEKEKTTIKLVIYYRTVGIILITRKGTFDIKHSEYTRGLMGVRGVFTVFDNGVHPDLHNDSPAITRSMLLTSYRRKLIDRYEKIKTDTVFMPPWREDEIRRYCTILQLDEGSIETKIDRYKMIGGIPRYILRNSSLEDYLEDAVKKTTPMTALSDIRTIMEENFSHRVIHVDIQIAEHIQYTSATQTDLQSFEECTDFFEIVRKPSYRFASNHAANLLTDSWICTQLHEFVTRLLYADDMNANCLVGKAWEIYACRKLRQGGEYTLKHSSGDLIDMKFCELPKLPVCLNEMQPSMNTWYGCFCMPWKDNSPLFDALTVTRNDGTLYFNLFQMTLSRTHSMKYAGIELLCNAFGLKDPSLMNAASSSTEDIHPEFCIRFIYVIPAFRTIRFRPQKACPSSWPTWISSRTSIYVLKMNLTMETELREIEDVRRELAAKTKELEEVRKLLSKATGYNTRASYAGVRGEH